MEYRYAFLLGRPGCGKSALYSELEARLLASGLAGSCERRDDFPMLWARFAADDALEEAGEPRIYTRRIPGGGYRLTDMRLFDEILVELNADLLDVERPNHLVVVEFARSKNVQALRHFDEAILRESVVIYMQVSFETCWKRNVARFQAEQDHDGDDHMVFREEMERIYLHDDRDALVQSMKQRDIPIMVLDNEADGEDHLRGQVDTLFDTFF